MTRLEREIRRRERERLRRVNSNGFHVFTTAMQILMIAIALIIGLAIWFWAAEQQALDVQASVLRSHRIWDGPLYGPKVTMVEPLPDFPPVDGEPPEAIEIVTKDATAAEAVPAERWESLGVWKLTAYCPCEKCNGRGRAWKTASGAPMVVGRTVAVGGLPFGTELMINGQTYVVEDRGVHGHHVDILHESHAAANRFGVKRAEVFIKR